MAIRWYPMKSDAGRPLSYIKKVRPLKSYPMKSDGHHKNCSNFMICLTGLMSYWMKLWFFWGWRFAQRKARQIHTPWKSWHVRPNGLNLDSQFHMWERRVCGSVWLCACVLEFLGVSVGLVGVCWEIQFSILSIEYYIIRLFRCYLKLFPSIKRPGNFALLWYLIVPDDFLNILWWEVFTQLPGIRIHIHYPTCFKIVFWCKISMSIATSCHSFSHNGRWEQQRGAGLCWFAHASQNESCLV